MEDKRARKTKKAIINAFAELMAEKNIQDISVKEIAEKADINRITFYNHYADIYDLFDKMQSQVLADFDEMIAVSDSHNYEETFEKIVKYLAENKVVCKLTMSAENSKLQTVLCELFLKKYNEISMYEDNVTEIKKSWNYLAVYNVYGTIALLSQWIMDDMEYPAEKIRDLLTSIDNCMDNAFYAVEE